VRRARCKRFGAPSQTGPNDAVSAGAALAGALAIVVALASCQNVDGNAEPDRAVAGVAEEAAEQNPTVADRSPTTYPSLSTVPRRPKLTYTVAQRRAIVEGLVADLENARYTDRSVRYRSGLSALPPPPPPPQWQVAEVATAQAEELVPEAPAKPQPSEEETAAPEVTSQADNGGDSLDDFVTELAEQSQALAVDGDSADPTLSEADPEEPPQEAQDQSQRAWREPPTIVGWWEQWFGGDSSDEPAEEGAGEVGPSSSSGGDFEPVTERIEDAAVMPAAATVLQVGGEAPEGDVGNQSPPVSHGSGALGGAMTVLVADEALGTPVRLMPGASWPTSPAPLPSPRKPLIVVVQPIPEPSVPIDVEDGLLAVPTTPGVDVEAFAPLERDGAQVTLVRAGR
jgi:hypothetical protein